MNFFKIIIFSFMSLLLVNCSEEEKIITPDPQKPLFLYAGDIKIGKIFKKFSYNGDIWYLVESIKKTSTTTYTLANQQKGYQIPIDGTYISTYTANDTKFTLPFLQKDKSFYKNLNLPTEKSTQILFEIIDAKDQSKVLYWMAIPTLSFDISITDGDGTLYDGTPVTKFFSIIEDINKETPIILAGFTKDQASSYFPIDILGKTFIEKEE